VVSLLALIAAFVCVMFCLRVLLKWEMQVKDHESTVDEVDGSTWVSNGCVHWWVLGSFPLKLLHLHLHNRLSCVQAHPHNLF
jgi:predicted Co/Zn/Cd cation transporter (cation efflux family)